MGFKAVFLDRDGVINRDSPDYIKNWEEFEFLPRSLEALNLLHRGGLRAIVITNQSIVNRGMVPLAVLQETHRRLIEAVARTGGCISDIFFCPHRPDERCGCRKPEPGLIRQACQRYAIDPADSVMIGDSPKDIACARAAGCGAAILVRTGNGGAAERDPGAGPAPDAVADDLYEAVRLVLSGLAAAGPGR